MGKDYTMHVHVPKERFYIWSLDGLVLSLRVPVEPVCTLNGYVSGR
jgi:hypothetical protein